ncbi:MAG: hypothetical protein CVV28_02680 [Methanobacteriales archaeon HGW-Methanobacteriales-1]|jgi:hypothetical protein|nr:MAG: hypothetical protein CVV28_02680 [Methanobacteriales archaeon HGW-Methanobacteriales-1]
MDSRALLQGKKVRIFIDSQFFNYLLDNENINAQKILIWANAALIDSSLAKYIEFFRSKCDTSHDNLDKLDVFKFEIDKDFDRIEWGLRYGQWTFPHEFIEMDCKRFFGVEKLDFKQKRAIYLLIDFNELVNINDNFITNFLITDDKILLKNRLAFEKMLNKDYKYVDVQQFNIVNIDEAREIIDLFFKINEKYTTGQVSISEWQWYWYSFRNKVPFFNVHIDDDFYSSFANRFNYVLKSIDEMGIQYYKGTNNNTQINIMYYFNYYISLVTGIFDNLAIITKNQYNLEFEGDNYPSSISFNPKAGRNFLNAIRTENQELRNHLIEYNDFILLLYRLREVIIHKEMLGKSFFTNEDKTRYTILKIDELTERYIRVCGDKNQKYDSFTQWGIFKHKLLPETYFLEPYHFANSATNVLIKFSNTYLKLLGEANYIDEERKKKDKTEEDINFLWIMDNFQECHLGF